MAQIVYTFYVDDTSPSVSYSPFADTFSTPNLLAGWNPYFTESGFATSQGQIGNGTSLHISSLDGSSVSLQWRGIGIEVIGNATSADYTITLDGEPKSASADGDVLARFADLTDTNHTITLTTRTSAPGNPDSFIAFDKFIVTSLPVNDVTNLSISNGTLPDQNVAFTGAWSFQNNTDSSASAHQSTTAGDRATAKFLGTAFFLHGQTSPSAGRFIVNVDGTNTSLSARSSFTQSDSLLYFVSGLDLNITHSVQVINDDGGALTLQTDGFMVSSTGNAIPPDFTPSPSPALPSPTSTNLSTSFPKGTIAALVLAGILAFILITLLLLYLFVLRPRRRRRWQPPIPPSASQTKEFEAAGTVLDIGPSGPRGEHSAGLAGFIERRDSRAVERWWERENRERRSSGGSKSKRASGRSTKTGFARWKEEMEHGFSGRGLGGLGLVFRHSLGGGTVRSGSNHLSDGEKSPKSPDVEQDKADEESNHEAVSSTPSSNDSTGIAVVSRIISGKRVKTRKKKNSTTMSARKKGDSPSFTLDFPLPTLSRNGGSRNHSPHINHSRSSGSIPQSAPLPVSGQHRSSSHSQSLSGQSGSANGSNRGQQRLTPNPSDSSPALSYISSPINPPNEQSVAPNTVTAAASAPVPISAPVPAPSSRAISPPNRPASAQPRPLPVIRTLVDAPPASTSRPSSRDQQRPTSVRPLPIPTATPSSSRPSTHQHNRSDSLGFLLQSGGPNPGSSDDNYRPTEYRPTDTTPVSDERVMEQASRGLLMPPQSLSRGDRGSISSGYVTDMDGVVRAETTTGQIAIRGLSPRTSETGRLGHSQDRGSTPSLSIDTNISLTTRMREKARSQDTTDIQPALPEVSQTSPFHIDFSAAGAIGGDSKGEPDMARVRFHGDPSQSARPSKHASPVSPDSASPSGTTAKKIRALPRIPVLQQKSSFRLTPPSLPRLGSPPMGSPERSDSEGPISSFLDFGGSSAEGSIMTQSNDSSSHRKSKSRWSGPSMITSLHRRPSTNAHSEDDRGQGQSEGESSRPRYQSHSHSSSSGKGSNSSSGFPFPVSLPPSPHHPPGSFSSMQLLTPPMSAPLPQTSEASTIPRVNIIGSSPQGSIQQVEPVRARHPSGLPTGGPVSPTDSIPMSVSDIHFRHSDSESTGDSPSRPTSVGSHLPPHPPLPGIRSPTSSEFIVQRVLGITPPHSAGSSERGRTGSGSTRPQR